MIGWPIMGKGVACVFGFFWIMSFDALFVGGCFKAHKEEGEGVIR